MNQSTKKISVIIPVFNEEDFIRHLLEHLHAHQSGLLGEVIVVDGGSSDNTIEEALRARAKVVRSPGKGRATQMNLGAEQAGGDILFFLHADSFPPEHFDQLIIRSVDLHKPWGSFSIRFDTRHWLLNFIGWLTRFNFTLFRFGDQGLFVTKELFDAAGGYDPEKLVFEDTDIARRLGAHSKGQKILRSPVVTSARKFRDNGIFKLAFIFLYLWVLYLLGMPHGRILSSYQALIIQDKI